MTRIVSTGELRSLFDETVDNPKPRSTFAFSPLPARISRAVYVALSEDDRTFYVGDPAEKLDGYAEYPFGAYVLAPGSYDAWMVMTS